MGAKSTLNKYSDVMICSLGLKMSIPELMRIYRIWASRPTFKPLEIGE